MILVKDISVKETQHWQGEVGGVRLYDKTIAWSTEYIVGLLMERYDLSGVTSTLIERVAAAIDRVYSKTDVSIKEYEEDVMDSPAESSEYEDAVGYSSGYITEDDYVSWAVGECVLLNTPGYRSLELENSKYLPEEYYGKNPDNVVVVLRDYEHGLVVRNLDNDMRFFKLNDDGEIDYQLTGEHGI